MKIQAPDLRASSLMYLATCGRIRSPSTELRAWAAEDSEAYIYYQWQTPHGPICARVDIDDLKDHIHFHVDLATREWFRDKKLPKATKNAPDFVSLVEPVIGKEIELGVYGSFDVPLESLPRALSLTRQLEIKKGDLTIKMTGGELSVKGSPIEEIEWRIGKKAERVIVSMRGEAVFTLSNSYFEDCVRFLVSFARTFFESDVPNV